MPVCQSGERAPECAPAAPHTAAATRSSSPQAARRRLLLSPPRPLLPSRTVKRKKEVGGHKPLLRLLC